MFRITHERNDVKREKKLNERGLASFGSNAQIFKQLCGERGLSPDVDWKEKGACPRMLTGMVPLTEKKALYFFD